VVENVDADDATGSLLSHLDRVFASSTAEVGDDGPGDLSPNALTEQDLELAPASVGAAAAVSLSPKCRRRWSAIAPPISPVCIMAWRSAPGRYPSR
jgi:hypothetical protein